MSTPTRSIAARGIEGAPAGRSDPAPTAGIDATEPSDFAGGSR